MDTFVKNKIEERNLQEFLDKFKNPELWDKDHIDHWLTKVENYYGLQHIDRTNMPGDGRSLCRLSAEEFQQITGDRRTADILSNYLDCVRQNIKFSSPSSLENTDGNEKKKSFFEAVKQVIGKAPKDKSSSPSGGGQIQLWQFLLELLFDPKYSSFIGWQDDNGTFRFFDPEGTARLWGERKFREEKSKKPMNYDKLSRSLRHYYMKGIIIKVSGQKYTYKFIADGVLRACAPSGMSDSQFIYANIDPSTCDENSPRNYHLDFTITC